MDEQTRRQVREALERSWSPETCLVFNPDVPAANHCAQTAILMQRKFGGDILMTRVRGDGVHFYNRLEGKRIDFTADQFTAIPHDRWNVEYEDVFEALDEHVEAIARETKAIGLVVLRGAQGNFSAGYEMSEVLEYVKAHAKPHYHSEVIDKLANLPQPVISAVEGHCSTGALELALAADLIVASESARFSDVYARWGLTPIWGLTLRLPHRIGMAKASEMLLTGRSYSGREAHGMHLANFCFANDTFETELAALCSDILANSWFANQVTKHAIIETDGLTLRDAYALDLFKNEGLAPDAAQRAAKFFKRRKPGN